MRIYTETQRMRDSVFSYILGASVILYFIGMIVVFSRNIENQEGMIISVSISLVILFLVAWLFAALKLEVRIEETRLVYRMPPLINKEKVIQKDEISSYEVSRYKPVMHYGGWGIRYSMKHGKAYSISGNKGLRLHLKSGKTILLGTRQMDEIKAAMDNMMQNSENYA